MAMKPAHHGSSVAVRNTEEKKLNCSKKGPAPAEIVRRGSAVVRRGFAVGTVRYGDISASWGALERNPKRHARTFTLRIKPVVFRRKNERRQRDLGALGLQLPDIERLLLLGDFNVEGQGVVTLRALQPGGHTPEHSAKCLHQLLRHNHNPLYKSGTGQARFINPTILIISSFNGRAVTLITDNMQLNVGAIVIPLTGLSPKSGSQSRTSTTWTKQVDKALVHMQPEERVLIDHNGHIRGLKSSGSAGGLGYCERKTASVELDLARVELSSHQLEVPDMVRLRGELVISSIYLHLAASLALVGSPEPGLLRSAL
ncbi:hypothetical protein B0H13DRAFT_1851117 [Mycena leptocephala]|nr:hypothetical protein B0H13DRAFT_1851117 [Mycena leptocephala]